MIEFEFEGRNNRVLRGVRWNGDAEPEAVVVITHGYGEHIGRYDHVAQVICDAGAVAYGHDHYGHGKSEGDRAVVTSIQDMVDDLHTLLTYARSTHAGLPCVLIGHSMGGIVATRYAQTHRSEIDGLVLSGPVVGGNPDLLALADMDPIPDVPIDPAALSRDPSVGEAYAADPLIYHGPFARETLVELGAAVEAIAADPGFGDLPVLWIHGENDPLAPYAVTKDAMVHLRGDVFEEVMYPGAMHEIFNETNSDEVLGDVVDFISQHVTAA
jgi:alpha-beta hydrolase superfamily lysophospholipase